MTVAAPGYLLGALAAAIAVVALHFIAWRRPRPRPLPTARFVPQGDARAATRELQLTDVALLAARVSALLLAGLALADPRIPPRRSGRVVVVAADRSRAVGVGTVPPVLDSLAKAYDVARVVWFDSIPALPVDGGVSVDSLALPRPVRGHLAAGVVAAFREATRLSHAAARVDVVVVSPFVRESWDVSLPEIRASWPGALGTRRTPPASHDSSTVGERDGARITARDLEDPVAVAVTRALGESSPVRSLRSGASSADSAFARRGGVVLVWPAAVPREHVELTTLTTGDVAVIGDMVRSARDSSAAARDDTSTSRPLPIAWDERGAVLAREQRLGDGCLRTIDIAPPRRGDLAISQAFTAVVQGLARPCDGADRSLVDDATLARWSASPTRAPVASTRDDATSTSWVRWLIVAAFAMLAFEWWLRRSPRKAAPEDARGTHAAATGDEAA